MSNTMPMYGSEDASYQAAGGYEGIKALVERFYQFMEELPAAAKIRAMHPQDLESSKDKLTRFLCGWLGGPRLYAQKYGAISIPGFHRYLAIGDEERDAWLLCMARAAQEQQYDPAFTEYLLRQLAVPAQRVRELSAAD